MAGMVIDASVALKWLLPESGSDQAIVLIERYQLYAPDLLIVECANALWLRVRRGEMVPADAKSALADLEAAPIGFASDRDLTETVHGLAVDLDHPVYDCLYLALGLRWAVPVITADRRFVLAVRRHPFLANQVLTLDAIEP